MELKAEAREKFGKGVGELRRRGVIPAELYGHGIANIHLSVAAKDFVKVLAEAGESTIVNLAVGGERRPVLIHEVSRDPVSEAITHVDFYQVKMGEKIKIKVPLSFENDSPAVKEKGAVIVKAMYELEVEAMPGDIPHNVSVNLSRLTEIGDSVYVKDLNFSEKVKVLALPDTVVATAMPPAAEEEAPAVSEEEGVEKVVAEGEEKRQKAEAEKKEEKGGERSGK